MLYVFSNIIVLVLIPYTYSYSHNSSLLIYTPEIHVQVTDINIWIWRSRHVLYEAVLISLVVRSSPCHVEGPDLIPMREFYFRTHYKRRSKGKISQSIEEVRICSDGTFLNKLFIAEKNCYWRFAVAEKHLFKRLRIWRYELLKTFHWKYAVGEVLPSNCGVAIVDKKNIKI